MKKRRLIALAAAAVMAASSLAGCGGSQTSSTTAAGSTAETAAASSNAVSPDAKSTDQTLGGGIAVGSSDGEAVKGGTLVVSMPSSPRTLDPKATQPCTRTTLCTMFSIPCLSGIRITKR